MTNSTPICPSYSISVAPAERLIEAMNNKTGLGLLALDDAYGLDKNDKGFILPADYLEDNLPTFIIEKAVKNYGEKLTLVDLYDNQDEFGAVMPDTLMITLSSEQVATLKNEIKQVLSVLLGIHSLDDYRAFSERVRHANNSYARLGRMSFSLDNSNFELDSEVENGEHVEVVEFRYRTNVSLHIDTSEYYFHFSDMKDFAVNVTLSVDARDFNGKSYVEIYTGMGTLVEAVFK